MDFYCLTCASQAWAVLYPLPRHLSWSVQLGHTEATWQGTTPTLAALSAQEAGVSTFG